MKEIIIELTIKLSKFEGSDEFPEITTCQIPGFVQTELERLGFSSSLGYTRGFIGYKELNY